MAKGDFEPVDENGFILGCAIRAVILDPENNFPLIRHKSGWLGLPGGRIKKSEIGNGLELITNYPPTPLIREVQEECDLDITGDQAANLGIIEMLVRHDRSVTRQLTTIFIVKHGKLPTNLSQGVVINNIHTHISGPLFPDARAAINRIHFGGQGPILPEFFNSGHGLIKFDMTSTRVGYTF